MTKIQNDYLKFLNPLIMKQCLILSSTFITLFEISKDCIILQVKDFYVPSYFDNPQSNKKYKEEVLSKDKKNNVLKSSILWLQENNVIDNNDINIYEEIINHRNELAHETISFLTDSNKDISIKLLGELQRIITKIDRWWIINVEIPTSGDFTSAEVDEMDQTQINSLRSLMTQLIINVAIGNDNEIAEIYEKFKLDIEKSG